MGRVLGIVYRTLAMHQIRKAGHMRRSACTGAVTLIQRFGGALNLNLNIHIHMLLLDGVYTGGDDSGGQPRFQRVKAPDRAGLEQLVYTISERTGRYLERQGLLLRDMDKQLPGAGAGGGNRSGGGARQFHYLGNCSCVALPPASMQSYRIAVDPQQGRKAFSLQTLPSTGSLEETSARVAKVAGFSLHAGVAAARHERRKLERLCRYITRPAIAERRLLLTSHGQACYDVKGFTNAAGAGMRRSSPTQDTVPGRHHACGVRTARLHGSLGGAGIQNTRCARGVGSAAAAGETDLLPWVYAPSHPLGATANTGPWC